MDERELVGLLYRADWTRLSLSGTVHGVNTGLHSIVTEMVDKGSGWSWSSATPPQPFTPPFSSPLEEHPSEDVPSAERTLVVAPGKRYREDSADGSYASGCDGKRVWQWYAQLPPDVSLRFDDRPRPPFPQLLAPSWLLTGYDLALDGEVTVCGRPCVRVLATPRERGSRGAGNRRNGWSGRSVGVIPVPLVFDEAVETWDEVAAVVDAELGILLRCSRRHGTGLAQVTEFLSLTAGGTAGGEADDDPARFEPPEGSVAGIGAERDGGRGRSGGGLGESLAGSLGAFGQEVQKGAAKAAAGMAAGGLGAAMKVTWSPPKDPFARATAEEDDPDAAMPRDDPAPQDGPGPAAPPVSDELLHLLYRSGAASPGLTATLHDWFDFGALLEAVPESARGAGFGGVGFLVDTFLSKARDSGLDDGHGVSRLRAGGWDRYLIDVVLPLRWIEQVRSEPSGDGRAWRDRDQMRRRTLACDGTRTWEVYDDRVVTGPAEPLPVEIVEQLDASWLLTYELSDAEEVSVDGGRRGYRVVVRKPEPLPTGMNPFLGPGMAAMLGKWTQLFFPAVAVVDAETGWLLRLTRYKGGRPVLRQELRDIAGLDSPDDFLFTPPAGLPVVDKSEESADVPPIREGIDLGDAARGAADAVKRQLDEKVAAARGFLGSFLGGRLSGYREMSVWALSTAVRRLAAQRLGRESRTRPVGTVLRLDREVPVDQHGKQPVRRRPCGAELGGHVADADLAGVAKQLEDPQRVIDRLDGIRRPVLHSRILGRVPRAPLPDPFPGPGRAVTVRWGFIVQRDDLPHLLGTRAIETQNFGQLSESGWLSAGGSERGGDRRHRRRDRRTDRRGGARARRSSGPGPRACGAVRPAGARHQARAERDGRT